ncbi:unnamed protein product [Linum tenue]|uniref:Uncharacterized protein n=1 Tax=Linum tenue TaxID=586396 RepID=A0AAV0JH44_9ROSI|nr:unnamed protein product [Linum tenue]
MESSSSVPTELYFVFMNYDPQYDRLRADRSVVLITHTSPLFVDEARGA